MQFGFALQGPTTRKTFFIFVILSWLCIIVTFRGAIWGESILAPLDIPASIYPKFKDIDPTFGPIPRNHYLIDMFDLVIPRQYLAHEALKAGEFPWWDPYTDGGRPLAVETHASITDPLRLFLYYLFPFVTAYNWSHILYSFLNGLSAYLLLSFLSFSPFITVLGALSFQFSGLQAILFYPEFVPNTLWCYPLLWVVLIRYYKANPKLGIGLGALICAAAFLAGSQQSHGWLVFFLICLVLGYGLSSKPEFKRLFLVAAAAFLVGCLIAAPVLVPQTQVFLISARHLAAWRLGKHLLAGIFSLTGIFPWLTGSFRSIDLSKIVDGMSLPYLIFLGTPIMIAASVGIYAFKACPVTRKPQLLTSGFLLITYFVLICSTPLQNLLYTRSAGLALLGILIFFGYGMESLIQNENGRLERFARRIVKTLGALMICVHIFAFCFYPSIKGKVLEKALQNDKINVTMPSVPELRKFQVQNLPREISFQNPEVLISFSGAVILLFFVNKKKTGPKLSACLLFICNLLPLLLFFHRYVPSSRTEIWQKLLAGGPEQKRIRQAAGSNGRFMEIAPTRVDYAVPGATSCFYRIHSLNGFSAFNLWAPGQVTSVRNENIRYVSTNKSAVGAVFIQTTNQVRFVWDSGGTRPVQIVSETLNSVTLHIAAGKAANLIRTDTYYPGWRLESSPTGIVQNRNPNGFFQYAIPEIETELVLLYEPSFSNVSFVFSLLGNCTALICILVSTLRPLRPVATLD
jgi:hypothetical protein